MVTRERRYSRRQLLGGAAGIVGAALAAGLPRPARGQNGGAALRIGVVVPPKTGLTPIRAATYQVAGEAAYKGAMMAHEEFSAIAEMLGGQLEVLLASAPTAEAAGRAAERLVALDRVFGLIGGFGKDACVAIGEVAERHRVPFVNIGCPSDELRGKGCRRYTFHFEASAAMYLDALADWFVREGVRRWFIVSVSSDEGELLLRRARKALLQRHWGGQEAGHAAVAPGESEFRPVIERIGRARPDMVLLLLDAVAQLDFLGAYEASGLRFPVTGFPEPVAQTRTFYAACRATAPRAGSGYRAALWEARLDNYGGRELNARFRERWGVPMDPPAWAAWEAVKLLWEAASFAGTTQGPALVEFLEDPESTFDVHKGIGVSFRPWDHQLRQTIFLVKVREQASDPWDLVSLVGELPSIHRPGFAPNEMLDQIGDLQRDSACRWAR